MFYKIHVSKQDLEAEVNLHQNELIPPASVPGQSSLPSADQLLTNQLLRLAMCLDVYLEAEYDGNTSSSATDFVREKVYSRVCR